MYLFCYDQLWNGKYRIVHNHRLAHKYVINSRVTQYNTPYIIQYNHNKFVPCVSYVIMTLIRYTIIHEWGYWQVHLTLDATHSKIAGVIFFTFVLFVQRRYFRSAYQCKRPFPYDIQRKNRQKPINGLFHGINRHPCFCVNWFNKIVKYNTIKLATFSKTNHIYY